MEDSLDVQIEQKNHCIEISLIGKLFGKNCHHLLDQLYLFEFPNISEVIFLMKKMTYIDSNGLVSLLQINNMIKGLGGIRGSMFVEDRTQQPAVLVSADDLFWFLGEVVVRIRDVHIFITYEAFDADTGPKDVPGFPLRRARTLFGLKWEFWN